MSLHKFDVSLLKKYSARVLIGIDEAGRGPIAGPVTAAACIIPIQGVKMLCDVRDSKKLTPLKRKEIYDKLAVCGVKYAAGFIYPGEIDRTNILQATFKAMRKALKKLGICKNTLVAVDGNHKIPDLNYKQVAIVSGDNKSLAVASAGIIAKVTRDKYMEKMAKIYPDYGFEKHKGYGTKLHYEILERLGPCPEHRRSFMPMWYLTEQ